MKRFILMFNVPEKEKIFGIKNLYTTILLFITVSCQTNWGKYGGYKMDYESALDYYIVLDKVDTVLANYQFYNRGAFVKFYHSDKSIDTLFVAEGARIINPFVDAKRNNFNEKFILVAQKPLDSICECTDSCLDNNLPTYQMCFDELMKSRIYQYWIIDKIEDAVYGPLTWESYLLKREELGVPKDLVFREM